MVMMSIKAHKSSFIIYMIDKLKGNSQVTHVRGKARFFYDYSFELSFEISCPSHDTLNGE